jgi:transposase-like protein
MDRNHSLTKTCPECGSTDYLFRGRKKIATDHGQFTDTKYRCKLCGKEWKMRISSDTAGRDPALDDEQKPQSE